MIVLKRRRRRNARHTTQWAKAAATAALVLVLLSPSVVQSQEALLLSALNASPRVLPFPGDALLSVAVSPDGALLAGGATDGTITLWDLRADTLVHVMETDDGMVHDVDFSPNGERLASGHSSGSMYIFDVARGRAKGRFTDHAGAVTAVAFSPDGRFLVSGSEDKEVWVRSSDTGRTTRVFREHLSPVSAITFSRDGRRVATGDDSGSILVWAPATGERTHGSRTHDGQISDLVFSSDAYSVFSGSTDGKVMLTALPAARGDEVDTRLVGEHASPVVSIALASPVVDASGVTQAGTSELSPYVIAGYASGSLLVWSTEDEGVIYEFAERTTPITTVSLSSDRRLLASASEEGVTLHSWPSQESYRAYAYATEKHPDLFRPKGEFEPTSVYARRRVQALETLMAFLDAVGSGEVPEDVPLTATTVALSIDNVGLYNADTETFPITIGGRLDDVHVPLSEAPSFKDVWEEAEVRGVRTLRGNLYEVDTVDIRIAHPVLGSIYAFGIQEDIEGTTPPFSPGDAPATTSTRSPVLSIYTSFTEPSGNGLLDAGEHGTLYLVIENDGLGVARDLQPRLFLSNDLPGFESGPVEPIPYVLPGGSQTVSVPISAQADVQAGTARLSLELSGANGYELSPPVAFSIGIASSPAAARAPLNSACEGAIARAESSYFEASFDEAIKELDSCLSQDALGEADREQAYALLGKVHFVRGADGEALASLRMLMTIAPDYTPDPLREPPDFVSLVEEVRLELDREDARRPVEVAPPLGPDDIIPVDTQRVVPAPID